MKRIVIEVSQVATVEHLGMLVIFGPRFLASSQIPHSCCPNAIIDSAQTHAVLRALGAMTAVRT